MMHPRMIHFALGWVALASVGSLALVVPQAKALARVRQEVRSLESELAKPADGPEVLERLAADLTRLREFGKGRMTPIPEDSDVAGLMRLLSETLDELGLSQRDITTRPPKDYGDATSMPVTVVLNGPFTSIYDAVTRIEAMPRLVRIERLRITSDQPRHADPKSAASDLTGKVRAEFSVDAFYAARNSDSPPDKSGAKGARR